MINSNLAVFFMGVINTGKTKLSKSIVTASQYLDYLRKNKIVSSCSAPRAVVFSFSSQATEQAMDYFHLNPNVKKINKTLLSPNGEIGVCQSTIGAPAAVVMMEELIAWGVKSFIVVGVAGSLVSKLKAGDIVVCDHAFRDEGTSYHYLEPSLTVGASDKLTTALEETLKNQQQLWHKGGTWTTDAPYRETMEDISYFREKDALVVDMEISALYSVASFYGRQIAGIVAVSDCLADGRWKPQFKNKKLGEALKNISKMAFLTLEQVDVYV